MPTTIVLGVVEEVHVALVIEHGARVCFDRGLSRSSSELLLNSSRSFCT
jgi:hypothetical protein